MGRSRGEERNRIRGVVGDERNQPDQRQGEQRDAEELADAARDGGAVTHLHISINTGSTSGRRPERFLKNRRSSTRSFSVIRPWSVRSSTLDASTQSPMTRAASLKRVGA